MPVPGAGAPLPKPAGGALRTADGRPVDLAVNQQQMRDLGKVLKPGEVVTGRVVEQFDNGSYLFTLRGRNMIAQSTVPLLQDSVVQFEVLSAKNGVQLRMVPEGLAAQSQSTAGTSLGNGAVAQRLQALGLPDTAAARMVLAAFESIDAPLHPAGRLQAATQALTADGGPGRQTPTGSTATGSASQGTTPAAGAQGLAQAHALVAKAGLPATPLLLGLAERTQHSALPNPAAALRQLAQALPPGALAAGTASPGGNPSPGPGAGTPLPTPTPGGSATTTVSTATAVGISTSTLPSPGRSQQAPGLFGTATPGTPPTTGSPNPAPGSTGTSAPNPQLNQQVSGQASPATQTTGNQGATSPGVANTATAQGPLGGTALPLSLPDPGQGRPSVQQALTLSGLRPEAGAAGAPELQAPSANTPEERSSASPLALDGNRVESQVGPGRLSLSSASAQADADLGGLLRQLVEVSRALPESDPAGRQALHQAARELAAETVFKPQALSDYDMVLPFASQNQGQPVPARIAVAQRSGGNSTATFLRIDLELDRLGPLSLRLNDSGTGGPIVITIFAAGASVGVLEDEVAALEADLDEQGLTAAIRVGDLIESGHD